MPQFLVLLAIGAGIYAGSKWLFGAPEPKAAAAKKETPGGQQAAKSAPVNGGTLEFDAKDNIYRPKT